MSLNRRRLRIAFLTHYFPPEVGAPQTRMFELARRLHDGGDAVTVITAFPNYPTGVVHDGYGGRFAMEESIDGVRVLRRWVFATPNAGFLKRIVNHFSFVLSSLTALRAMGHVDVIFVQSPPLPIGIAAMVFSVVKRAPFVFNVSDIWPQSAIELGALRNPVAIRLAEMLERLIYRRAARITVPTNGILRQLADRGVQREKLVLLTNGVDVDVYDRQAPNHRLARRLGLEGRKVFMYAGTHGMSQGLDVILEAATQTHDPDVLYVLAGDGADKESLVARAEREEIQNVRFLPTQPKSTMPSLLNLAYAGVISLKPLEVFRAALPSKMFESMAVRQPLVGSIWGEAADLIEEARCGVVVEPGDPAALARAVELLAADPALAREMGERGRAYVVEHFNRRRIASRLRELLNECVSPPAARPARLERALDVALAVTAFVLALPVIGVAALAIRLNSDGPVFHHGVRVGRNGSLFRIHKLRTMRAESEGAGPAVTAGDDPRITEVGRVLRRTKLDELPQLVNVLKGDMSLVGPRPEHPEYVKRYSPAQRRLLSVRPGMTGPATLANMDEEDELRGGHPEAVYVHRILPRKLQLELDYLDRATAMARLGILIRTTAAVLRRPFGSSKGSRGRSRRQLE